MQSLNAGQRLAALWASLRHDEWALRAIASFNDGAYDFWDDVRGFSKHDDVPNHQSLIFDEVFVIQGCALNKAALDTHGL